VTGDEFLSIRKQLKLTRPDLANSLGCSPSLIKKMERGETPITPEREEALGLLSEDPSLIERTPTRRGRPPGTANGAMHDGSDEDENGSPAIAASAAIAALSLPDMMRSPWFWVAVTLAAAGAFWWFQSTRPQEARQTPA
jgi:transcriptional regulator with XRE-family HTH domain